MKITLDNFFSEKSIDVTFNCNYISHYTSNAGLEAIMQNDTLWFTESEALNDYNEGKILEKIVKDIKIKDTKIRDKIVKYISEIKKNYTFFICCFSKNNDCIPMWNYYCKSDNKDGYAIIFDNDLIKKQYNDFNKVSNIYKDLYSNLKKFIFASIVYDENEQKRIIKDFIDYIDECGSDKNNEQILKDFIIHFLYLFKNKDFKHEEEVRIIYCIHNTEVEGFCERGKEFILLRKINGLYYRYLNIKFDPCILKQIKISPVVFNRLNSKLNYKEASDLIKNSLKKMLIKNGKGNLNIKILCSNVSLKY